MSLYSFENGTEELQVELSLMPVIMRRFIIAKFYDY